MTIATELELKRRIAELVGMAEILDDETELRDWEMIGVFDDFRGQPDPLQTVFVDLPQGEAVFDRLSEVLHASRPDDDDGQTVAADVVPRSKENEEMLRQKATAWLHSARQMACAAGDEELSVELTGPETIYVLWGKPPTLTESYFDTLESRLYELSRAFAATLSASCPAYSWLGEACHSIASDDFLSGFVRWPWVADSSKLDDPYRPYFELWRTGAEMRFPDHNDLRLYVGE